MNCNNCIKSLEKHYRESTGIASEMTELFGNIINLRKSIDDGKYSVKINDNTSELGKINDNIEQIEMGLRIIDRKLSMRGIEENEKYTLENAKTELLNKGRTLKEELNEKTSSLNRKESSETRQEIRRKKEEFVKDLLLATKLILYPNQKAVIEVLRMDSWDEPISNLRNIYYFDPTKSSDLKKLSESAFFLSENLPEKFYDKEIDEDGYTDLLDYFVQDKEYDNLDKKVAELIQGYRNVSAEAEVVDDIVSSGEREQQIVNNIIKEQNITTLNDVIPQMSFQLTQNRNRLLYLRKQEQELLRQISEADEQRKHLFTKKMDESNEKMRTWLKLDKEPKYYQKLSYIADTILLRSSHTRDADFSLKLKYKLDMLFELASLSQPPRQ